MDKKNYKIEINISSDFKTCTMSLNTGEVWGIISGGDGFKKSLEAFKTALKLRSVTILFSSKLEEFESLNIDELEKESSLSLLKFLES